MFGQGNPESWRTVGCAAVTAASAFIGLLGIFLYRASRRGNGDPPPTPSRFDRWRPTTPAPGMFFIFLAAVIATLAVVDRRTSRIRANTADRPSVTQVGLVLTGVKAGPKPSGIIAAVPLNPVQTGSDTNNVPVRWTTIILRRP